MSISWDKAYLIGRSWRLNGKASDISKLVKTIVNEYESQSKNSQKTVLNAIKEYSVSNNVTEFDVCSCLNKANKNIK